MISESLPSPMDSSELVYIVASDDDLPISLQVLRADGTLQPRILPKPSLHCASGDHRGIAVCDEQGNDMTDDVTVDVFEYVVDENCEVFQLNSKPNVMPSLNYSVSTSVNTTDCNKSLISEDIKEPNMMTDLKVHDASQSNSHMNLHNELHGAQEHDEVDVTVADSSLEVSVSSHKLTVNSCGNHSMDDCKFLPSATAETNRNDDTAATALGEENPLPVCLNTSPSSNNLQSGNCSVPSSAENLCIHDSVSEVDLVADDNCKTMSCLSTCLSSAEKHTTTCALDTVTTVASCAVTNAVTCGATDSVVQILQPCASVSSEYCSTLSSCEAGNLCQCSADQSEINCMSASCSSDDIVKSGASSVSSLTDSSHANDEANSELCMHAMHSKASVADCAADCRLDSHECQFADHLCKPAASCGDSSVCSISSCSSISEHGSYTMEQHSDDHLATVIVPDISPSDVLVSRVNTSEPDQSNVDDCSQSECVHDCTDVVSAEKHVLATEMPPSSSISGAVNYYEVGCTVHMSDCDDSVMEEFVQQKDVTESPNDMTNVNVVDDMSSDSIGLALDATSTAASKGCVVSELSSDTVGFVTLNKEQEFPDTDASTECQLQSEYTVNHTYNGCQRDLLKAARSFPSNVHELRQRLRVLHKVKNQLRKLQRDEPQICASKTDRLQTNTDLGAFCDTKCKRLRLESIDHELTNREVLLRHREQWLDVRLQRVEQCEQDLCKRERLLEQYYFYLQQQENPVFVTGSHKSDAVETYHRTTWKHRKLSPAQVKGTQYCIL